MNRVAEEIAMKPLAEVAGQELIWTQPKFLKRAFQLLAGEEVVATLELAGAIRPKVVAATAEERWSFHREGVFSRSTRIESIESGAEVARFEENWRGGGTLTFQDGREYQWKSVSFWRGEYGFVGADLEPVVRLRTHGISIRNRAQLVIEPSARRIPGLGVLATLGWFLMLRPRRRGAH